MTMVTQKKNMLFVLIDMHCRHILHTFGQAIDNRSLCSHAVQRLKCLGQVSYRYIRKPWFLCSGKAVPMKKFSRLSVTLCRWKSHIYGSPGKLTEANEINLPYLIRSGQRYPQRPSLDKLPRTRD